MKKTLLLLFTLFIGLTASAQKFDPDTCHAPDEYENVAVQRVFDDSLNSTFVIWVKIGVKAHYHANHTESITVLEGEAKMTVGDETFTIKKGDVIFIPKGTTHSVTVTSKKPLKVISTQCPYFDGSDRVYVE